MKYTIFLFFLVFFYSIPYTTVAQWKPITREEAFIFLADNLSENIPESFQYIDILYSDILFDTQLEDALQKLIYLDEIQNHSIALKPKQYVDIESFAMLTKSIYGVDVKKWGTSPYVTNDDLTQIKKLIEAEDSAGGITIHSQIDTWNTLSEKQRIFKDVYKTLQNKHYDRAEFDDETLMDAAIQWLTNGTDDTYTTYFPPVESNDFFDGLEWEYEGIGAYVHMPEPGIVEIVSPIIDGPAEKAWVQAGDRITHVDEKEITPDNPLSEVTSWIKWPAGSNVVLTILRDEETLTISVERWKIILKDVEHEKLNHSTYYIQIKNFWDEVEKEFQKALQSIQSDTSVKKIIFDVRNNPGGYLDEVSKILGYFVPEGEPTAIVSYGQKEIQYKSRWENVIDFWKYKLILLQNAGSASASEIMLGTIKDYYPHAVLMGEKSFGKGSVQTLKTYSDGSTLKYTSAKWFTGKSHTGIDHVGIEPDVQVEFNEDIWKKYKRDTQLEQAIKY